MIKVGITKNNDDHGHLKDDKVYLWNFMYYDNKIVENIEKNNFFDY